MEALEICLSHGRDIPFILISGAIGEETSVKVMKAGANDYIMKDKLIRLVPAVQRELMDAETRKQYREAQQSLKENEQKFRLFFENDPEYCYIGHRLNRIFLNTPTQNSAMDSVPIVQIKFLMKI